MGKLKHTVRTGLLQGLFIICALVISGLNVYAQRSSVSTLTTESGLSNMTINDIYVDEYEMVWIGTKYGLNRYDGHSVDVFFNQKNNPNSIPHSNVKRIIGNGNGRMWLLCQIGIAELDLNTMTFRTIYDSHASAIHYCDGCLYASTGSVVMQWSEEKQSFSQYAELGVPSSILDMHIYNEHIFLGTDENGVWKIDLSNHSQECLINSAKATRIYRDSKDDIWIGTWKDGLYRFGKGGDVDVFKHDGNDPTSISSNFIRSCCEDDNGYLWIGTDKGLECYNRNTGVFIHTSAQAENSIDKEDASIWCTTKDNQGNIWIGTYFGGVSWFNPEYEVYTWYKTSIKEGSGLSYPVAGMMVEDRKGNIWIATEGGGVNYLDRKSGHIRWYTQKNSGLSSNNIQSLYYDEDKDALWIGTHLKGLNRLDIGSGAISRYMLSNPDSPSITQNIIKDILPYGDSLILATHDGVYMFDTLSGRQRKMFKGEDMERIVKVVPDIYLDRDGALWICCENQGVLTCDLNTGKTMLFKPSGPGTLNDANVNSIIQDANGNMWFSTSGSGIDMYNPYTHTFCNYDSRSHGILSDRVYTFAQSASSSDILMSTSTGLCYFNPITKDCVNYDRNSGLPMSDINDNSICVTRDSTVFLGGIHGILSFKEGTQNLIGKPYRITMSKLFVNGREVRPSDETGILEYSLHATESISLKSDISLFSIEFSTSNYLNANKCELQYRLEGFSDEWNSVRNQNNITYSSLPSGKYRLVIRPDSHDETICAEASIDIVVLPPWYRSWWAWTIWILLAVIISYILLRSYNARLKLRQSMMYEKKKREDIEDLNQSKLRFFTNISHEIRTPLTVIIAQVEHLMYSKEFTPALYNKVLSIYKNSVHLKGLISELLEFRKQEQGELKIRVAPHDIVKMATEFYLVFREYAASRQIVFTMDKEVDHLEVWYDKAQMQKVLRNLISNALKYTEAGGEVNMFLGMSGNSMLLKIRDTGCGMSEDEKDNIFNNFYRIDRIESKGQDGTGIGLALVKGIIDKHSGTISVESVKGEGSTFTVTLPMGYSHFSADQILKDTVEKGEDQPEEVRSKDSEGKKDKTMLVVDDNESIRNLLAEIFAPFYNVITANDGDDGWEMARGHLPDIIISDVLMPRMPGTELCRRIKQEMTTCHIPVVLLTARVDIEQNIEGILTGADDYIAKPFNTRLLITRCNNLVNSRIILQEKFSQNPDVPSKMLATNHIDQEIIERATAIIEANVDNADFNINMFAHEMAMSRTNLFTKIKAITGQTPNDFIMTLRLKKAALMLRENPELSIAEIADRTGFASSKYFSKCFNDLYHIRPSSYRSGKDVPN